MRALKTEWHGKSYKIFKINDNKIRMLIYNDSQRPIIEAHVYSNGSCKVHEYEPHTPEDENHFEDEWFLWY